MTQQHRICRRDFLKLSATSAGLLASAALLPPQVPQAAQAQDAGPQATRGQLTQITPHAFSTAISAASSSGLTPTDVSMGWDGTVWAIDANGTPYLYDASLEQTANVAWVEYGEGIDSVGPVFSGEWLYTKGLLATAQFGSAPNQITSASGFDTVADFMSTLGLPPSFSVGLDGVLGFGGQFGAAYMSGGLYAVQLPNSQTASAPQNVTAIPNWNKLGAFWQDGVLDLVVSGGASASQTLAIKLDGQGGGRGAYIGWDGNTNNLYHPGGSLDFDITTFFGTGLVKLITAGLVDAMLFPFDVAAPTSAIWVFCGPWLLTFNQASDAAPASVQHVASVVGQFWPPLWMPQLLQAPSGRVGNLWSFISQLGGIVVQHDGAQWNPMGIPGTGPLSVATDSTDTTYCLSADGALYLYVPPPPNQPSGLWTALAAAPGGASQVAASDPQHIWVRTQAGAIYRYVSGNASNPLAPGGAFVQVSAGPWTDMAANLDGSLWLSSGNAALYRLMPEGVAPPEQIALPAGVTSVQRIGGARFGQTWALTTQNGAPQFFDYQSEHVFRTAQGYDVPQWASLAQGFGRLYFPTTDGALHSVDVQTGNPIAANPLLAAWRASTPVVDHVNGLIYVNVSLPFGDPVPPGYVYALDAATLQTQWRFTTPSGMDAPPTLSNGALFVGDRLGNVTAINAAAALAQAQANAPVTPAWTLSTGNSSANGVVMLAPQVTQIPAPGSSSSQPVSQLILTTLVPGAAGQPASIVVQQCNPGDGSGLQAVKQFTTSDAWDAAQIVPDAVVIGQDSATQDPALFIHGYTAIYAVNLVTGNNAVLSALTSGAYFSSLLSYNSANNTLYWGDTNGILYGGTVTLGIGATPGAGFTTRTWSAGSAASSGFVGRILPIPNAQGNIADSVSACLAENTLSGPQLLEYSFASNSVIASVPLNGTQMTALSKSFSDGVIYTAGALQTGPNVSLGQLFAVRMADVSAARNVIAECDLLQDYDEGPDPNNPGNTTALPFCRYQVHFTLTDETNTPLPYRPLFLWADEAATVRINTATYTIGPTTPALIETGLDGTILVFGGFVLNDGTDDTDVSHPALRVWSPFMGAFERVVIYPDQAFHNRLFNATTSDPTDDDPEKINLATAMPYNSTATLFTPNELANGTVASTASAITQIGLGVTQSAPQGATPFSKYVTYDDLVGVSYFPVNIPATRPIGRAQALGLGFDDTNTFTSYSDVGSATSAINAIPSTQAVRFMDARGAKGRLAVHSFFHDLWDKIKKGIAKVTHVIISIGQQILSGIRYIENQIAQVVQVVAADIQDIVEHVGTFFVKLGKDIDQVIQILGQLFNFTEILKTQDLLIQQFTIGTQNFSSTLTKQGIPAVNQLFGTLQGEVAGAMCKAKNAIDAGSCTSLSKMHQQQRGSARANAQPASAIGGMGTTAHSAFTVTPSGSNTPISKATQCTWMMHKVKAGSSSASLGVSAAPGDDPLADFFATFLQTLETDATLKQAWDQTRANFAATFKVNSASQFFKMAAVDLLDIIEDLAIGALAVIQALVDGLLTLTADIANELFGSGSAIGGTIKIPVISALYKDLTGNDLSILNLVALVAAVPVTILYRLIDGSYPATAAAQASAAQASAAQGGGWQANANVLNWTPWPSRLGNLFAGVTYFFLGIVQPFDDTLGSFTDTEEIPVLGWVTLALNAGIVLFGVVSIIAPATTELDVFLVVLGCVSLVTYKIADDTQRIFTDCFFGVLQLVFGIIDYFADGVVDYLALSVNIVSNVPSFAQPLGLESVAESSDELSLVGLLALDMLGNFATAGCAIADTVTHWGALPPRIHHVRLPWVPHRAMR